MTPSLLSRPAEEIPLTLSSHCLGEHRGFGSRMSDLMESFTIWFRLVSCSFGIRSCSGESEEPLQDCRSPGWPLHEN